MWHKLKTQLNFIRGMLLTQGYTLKANRFVHTGDADTLRLVTAFSGVSKDLSKRIDPKKGIVGDDAWFVSHRKCVDVLGIADGVGGWREIGVDPSVFSAGLMKQCQRIFEQEVDAEVANTSTLVEVLSKSYHALLEHKDPNEFVGSSTACLVLFNRKSANLHAANLGDSGFVVVRDNQVVHRSVEQQHYFNCPYQLAIYPNMKAEQDKNVMSDLPEAAALSSFKLIEGDVIVLATDGLWDNLHDVALLQILASLKGHFPEDLQKMAQKIVEKTIELSRDSNYLSPFALSARENGYSSIGGKPDDITLLLARVTR